MLSAYKLTPLATGLASTLGAFTIWGLAPIFWINLKDVQSDQLLAYRIIFSFVFASTAIFISDPGLKFLHTLKNTRTIATMLVSTSLIAVNWFVFLWAVQNGRVTEASLGYYTNPLLNILLGRLILDERLKPLQWLAVFIAAAGVGYFTFSLGTWPWVAIVLASSFSLYGLTRKKVDVPALPGLVIETLFCLPFCLLYLSFWSEPPGGVLLESSTKEVIFIVLSGIMTAAPLLLFSMGARRLPYSTVGMVQYLAPSLQLISAVYLFGEPFTATHVVTFGCIWTALGLYIAASLPRFAP